MTQYIDPFTPWEYGNETWNYMEQLRQDVFSSLGKEGSYARVQAAASKIYPQFQDYSKIFFVITPRTYYWLYDNQTFPTRVKSIPIDSSAIINNLENDNDLTLIFENGEVLYIYELEKK